MGLYEASCRADTKQEAAKQALECLSLGLPVHQENPWEKPTTLIISTG